MERLVNLPELLLMIFKLVKERPHPREMLDLALVCQGFHQPALGILWRDMRDLVPLVKCLPQDAWTEETADGYTVVKLIRSLQDHEIEKCRAYASHIRRIGHKSFQEATIFSHEHEYDSDSEEDDFIGMLLKGANLYSQINSDSGEEKVDPSSVERPDGYLEVLDSAVCDAFQDYGILPAPNLLSYTYTQGTSPRRMPLPRTLRSLNLLELHNLDDVSYLLMHYIKEMPYLEVLQLPACEEGLDEEVLRAILSSKSLRKLGLGFILCRGLKFLPKKGESSLRLRHLQVAVEDLEDCLMLLSSLITSELRSLKIEFKPSEGPLPKAIVFETFFRGLVSLYHDVTTLRKLYFWSTQGKHEHLMTSGHVLRKNTLKPLYAFSRLRLLSIYSDMGIVMVGEEIDEMLRIWPVLHMEFQFGRPRLANCSRLMWSAQRAESNHFSNWDIDIPTFGIRMLMNVE